MGGENPISLKTSNLLCSAFMKEYLIDLRP